MSDKINNNRRNLLIGTGVIGAIGAGFGMIPFMKSWMPSERAKASGGPIEVNISKVEIGQMLIVLWRGLPVFLVNRSESQTDVLQSLNNRLKDPEDKSSIQPDNISKTYRVKKNNFFVVTGICTHLGCVPKYLPELIPQYFDKEWAGGFYCPCHGSKFDISGRVFGGSPANRNLDIPPYRYLDENTIAVGTN